MTKKKSTEEFKKEVYDLVGDEYEVLGEYINTKTFILVRHNSKDCEYYKEFGKYYEYKVKPSDFKQGSRCPKCWVKRMTESKTKSTEEFKKEVYDLVGDEYEVLGEYKGNKSKIKIKHNSKDCEYYKEFGKYYEYEVKPNKFLTGRRCPECAKIKRAESKTKSTEEFKKEVYDLVGNEYEVLGEYIKNDKKIKIKHNSKECKYYKEFGRYYEYEVTPNRFLSGDRCPNCSKGNITSKIEKEIVEYIKTIYNKEIFENDRTILNGKELDIYLPDIKLAIEYNGIYWHNINNKSNKYYHLNKYNICKEKGITLITIWEDEYNENKDKYNNIIMSFINNDPLYDIKYENDLLYINKDYEDLNYENIIDTETNTIYEYIADSLPEIIKRKDNECWNIGYKIYKKIYRI